MKKALLLLTLFAALFVAVTPAYAQESHQGSVVGYMHNTSNAVCGNAQCWVHMWKGDGTTTLADGQVSQYTYSCAGHGYNWGQTSGFNNGCADPNPQFNVVWGCFSGCPTYNVYIQGRSLCPNGASYKYTDKRLVTLSGGVYGNTVYMGDMFANQPAGGCQPQFSPEVSLNPMDSLKAVNIVVGGDITCAAGATSCVRDQIRKGCVLLNPPYLQTKASKWRCPDPYP
jgi:hypothetical protein